MEAEAAEEEAEEEAGHRIKNKNPTQRCGELPNRVAIFSKFALKGLKVHF